MAGPGFGFGELMMLALLFTGQTSADLVALIQPQHYFQSRQIDVSIDKMVELAATESSDAKAQVLQLTALRYLTDESESLKKSPKYAAHRQTLEQIALGKKAQDSSGFSKEYAVWLLASLDGAKVKPGKASLLREDATAWFPAESNFLAAVDLRQTANFGTTLDPLRELLKLIPDEEKKNLYDFIEKVGNVRLEQASIARVQAKERQDDKIMIRFTGKGNQVWLADVFKSLTGTRFETKQIKDARGTPIMILQDAKRAPIIAFVGNTDLLIVGYEKDEANHEELLNQVLAAREKKKPNASTGVLKAQVARVPDKALAIAMGKLPDSLKFGFRFLNPFPQSIFAHVVRDPQGLDVNVETTMANADDAGKLINMVASKRKEGIEELKKAQLKPLPPGFPPIPFASLMNVLESLQVQGKADDVQIRFLLPEGLTQQLGAMAGLFMRTGGGVAPLPPPPPPPPAKELKKGG